LSTRIHRRPVILPITEKCCAKGASLPPQTAANKLIEGKKIELSNTAPEAEKSGKAGQPGALTPDCP
jgi:hypothetical protein